MNDTTLLPPVQPEPPHRPHRVRKVLLIIGGAFVALIVLSAIVNAATGHHSATPTPATHSATPTPATHSATKPTAAAGNATAACQELASWESGPATDPLWQDPAHARIESIATGTKFDTDFTKWLADAKVADTSAAEHDATQVTADCAAAGVPGVLPSSAAPATSAPAAAPSTSAPAAPTTPAAPAITTAEQQAIDAAQGYLQLGSGFSEEGLIQQLTSSAGNGFALADAQFAVHYLHPDWDAQAVEAAQGYMKLGGFSASSLIQQLTSDSGSGFTLAQAEYAVAKVGL